MGEGSPDPTPTFVIVVDDGTIAGWVDADLVERHEWLQPGEVNCGYHVFAEHRGRGLATRAIQLLGSHLARTAPDVHTVTLLIDTGNDGSLGVARRAGFVEAPAPKEGQRYFTKPVPPRTYTDGVVTIRPPTVDDAEAHTANIDDVQIDWLWLAGQREDWESKTPDEQLAHQRRFLERTAAEWGRGPTWWFCIDVDGVCIGHVDANLANPYVPAGEANVSYSMAPDHRGKGYVTRAVRLVVQFVRDHTAAREAHIGVDHRNEASLRVAAAVGAREIGRYTDAEGHLMVRHVLAITR